MTGTLLVTGAGGFVGANLVRAGLTRGHPVVALVRPGSQPWRLAGIAGDVLVRECDLEREDQVREVVAEARPRWVFHTAAHGAYPTQTDLDRILAVNLLGTTGLVRACRHVGVERIVNTGSSSEYGLKDHPAHEREWLDPNSYYAVAKASATLFCRFAARQEGMPIPTLRLYSAYGPWEEPSRLLPTLIRAGLAGRLPRLVDPATSRDFVYVDDVVDAYFAAATARLADPGAVYNVGTGVQTSLAELVALAGKVLPIREAPDWGSMAPRSWDTDCWVANVDAIRADLGWAPRVGLEEGITRLARWIEWTPDYPA